MDYYYQSASQPVLRFEDFLCYIPRDMVNEFMEVRKPLNDMSKEEVWVRYGCVYKMKQLTEQKYREMNCHTSAHKRLLIEKLLRILEADFYAINTRIQQIFYRWVSILEYIEFPKIINNFHFNFIERFAIRIKEKKSSYKL